MITYIIQATLCWAVFYALYAGLLSRATFFHHNRAYLLGSLLLGLALPLVDWQWLLPAEQPELLVVTLQPITIGMENLEIVVTATAEEPGMGWWEALLAAYWLGVSVAGLRFAYGLRKLWGLYRSSERRKQDTYTLVLTEEWHAPFSFFNTLFWSRQMPYPPEDEKKIIRHELAHMRGWHSLDIMLVEVLGIVFWLSPMVYLYSRSLRVVHEYLADAAVLQTTRKKKQYGHLLLSQSQSGQPIVLANHFINSQLKKRILMMTKTRSKRHMLTRYLLAVPLILGLIVAFAAPENLDWEPQVFNTANSSFDKAAFESELQAALSGERNTETLKSFGYIVKEAVEQFPEAESAIKEIANGLAAVYNMKITWEGNMPAGLRFNPGPFIGMQGPHPSGDVDRMPLFAGCEAMEEGKAQYDCTQKKVVEFVTSKLKYPEEARKAKVEGRVIVQYTIAKDGSVENAQVVKGIGYGCDEAALAVVNAMPKWTPAMKDGEPVALQMTLPFTFSLPQEETQAAEGYEEVFKVVEEMPRFPGCEDKGLSGQELVNCSNKELLMFIYKNIQYPKEARSAGIQGTAIVSFIIDKEGRVKDINIVRSLGEALDQEVIRVVNLMNEAGKRWIPGRQRGRVVNVQFNLPVKFALEGEEKEASEAEGQLPDNSIHVIGYQDNANGTGSAQSEEVFKVVEEMPRFPGCEEEGLSGEELVKCSNIKLITYVTNNLKYPREAKDAGVEGVAIVSFIVDKEGWVKDINIVRPLHESIDAEVIRVVKEMNKMDERWIPGRQRGKVVNVQFNLPVKFSLEAERRQLQLPEGAGRLELQNFKAAPNPTSGLLNLQFEADAKPTTIRILNGNGQEVVREALNRFEGTYSQALDLSSLPKGPYVLHISQGERIFAEKVIVK